MSDREHLTLYFYDGEVHAFDSRPSGASVGGWVIQLATWYVAADWQLGVMAARGTSAPTKLSVSLPAEVASALKERHTEPLSDVLRTLVLNEAGLALAPAAPGRVASVVSVALPASLAEHAPGWGLDALVQKLVRAAATGPKREALARVSLSRDTAEILERIRGDVPPAVLVSGLLARDASETEAAKLAMARPEVVSCDWRQYADVVARSGWPMNTLGVPGPLTPGEAEEVVRRLRSEPAQFLIAMDAGRFAPAGPASPDMVAQFHASVVAVVAGSGVRSVIGQANIPWGKGIVAIANVNRV